MLLHMTSLCIGRALAALPPCSSSAQLWRHGSKHHCDVRWCACRHRVMINQRGELLVRPSALELQVACLCVPSHYSFDATAVCPAEFICSCCSNSYMASWAADGVQVHKQKVIDYSQVLICCADQAASQREPSHQPGLQGGHACCVPGNPLLAAALCYISGHVNANQCIATIAGMSCSAADSCHLSKYLVLLLKHRG